MVRNFHTRLPFVVFPLLTRWSCYFGLWGGSFLLRMAEQQNRRSLGSLKLWNHSPQPESTYWAFRCKRGNFIMFKPPLLEVFSHSQMNLILNGITMMENRRVQREIMTEIVFRFWLKGEVSGMAPQEEAVMWNLPGEGRQGGKLFKTRGNQGYNFNDLSLNPHRAKGQTVILRTSLGLGWGCNSIAN